MMNTQYKFKSEWSYLNNKVFRRYLYQNQLAKTRPNVVNICRLIICTDASDNARVSDRPVSTSDCLEKVFPHVNTLKY